MAVFCLVAFAACGRDDGGSAMKDAQTERKVHRAFGAGRWFSASSEKLKAEVAGYVDAAEVPEFKGRIVGAIAPHAGFQYSGKVAGYAFRAIRDAAVGDRKPECVVVLGFTHRESYPGVAVLEADAIWTPLGETELDVASATLLVESSDRIRFNSAPHRGEHSAENEVPFVQAVLSGVPMVVALVGDRDMRTIEALLSGLDALSKKKRVLLVASSDMLHDPDYDLVTRTDKESLALVEKLDHEALTRGYTGSRQTFCGICPVLAAIRFAEKQGAKKGTVLHYRNCGDDFPESRGRWVVGYGAVVFVAE